MIFLNFLSTFTLSHPPFFPNPICDKFNSGTEFPWFLFCLLLQLTRKSSWGKAGVLAGPRGPWSNFSYLFSESTVCNFSVLRMMFSQSATQATRTKNDLSATLFLHIRMLFFPTGWTFLFFYQLKDENVLKLFLIINYSLWHFRFRMYWAFNYQCSCRMEYKIFFKFSVSRLFLKYS